MIYLLIGYMWLYIHRPFEVWPLVGTIHLERVYVLITLAYWCFYPCAMTCGISSLLDTWSQARS